MNQLRHLLALQLLLASSTVAAPDVWVVDDDGGAGVDFTDIQQAVDAAANLDTILIRDGSYGDVAVDGKALHLVAELGATVLLDRAQLAVRNLGPAQTVVARGLTVVGPETPTFLLLPPEESAAALLESNLGRVWLERCAFSVFALPSGASPQESPAVIANACAAVTLIGCSLTAPVSALGHQSDPHDRSALAANDSNVHLHDCELVGASGAGGPTSTQFCPAGLRGAGLSLDGGFASVSGSVLRGGDGLQGGEGVSFLSPGKGGDGGFGLSLVAGSGASAWTRDSLLLGGAPRPGGVHFDGTLTCPPGSPGAPLAANGQPVTAFPNLAESLASDSPTRTGHVSNVVFHGQPFDYVILGVSALQSAVPLAPYQGTLHLTGNPINLSIGFLDANGDGALPIFVPPNPAGFEALTYYLQTVHVTLALEVVLGPPATLTAVDPAAAP